MTSPFFTFRSIPRSTARPPVPALDIQRRRRRAFTLIEILIAMVVLAALAAISVPAISNYLAAAGDATMKDDLEKVMADGHLYFAQNSTYVGYTGTTVKLSPHNTLSVVSATATTLSLKVSNSSTSRSCVHSTDENPVLTCS